MAAGPIPETKKIVAAGVAADSIPSFWVLHVKSGCWDEWLLKHTYQIHTCSPFGLYEIRNAGRDEIYETLLLQRHRMYCNNQLWNINQTWNINGTSREHQTSIMEFHVCEPIFDVLIRFDMSGGEQKALPGQFQARQQL